MVPLSLEILCPPIWGLLAVVRGVFFLSFLHIYDSETHVSVEIVPAVDVVGRPKRLPAITLPGHTCPRTETLFCNTPTHRNLNDSSPK